MRELALFAGAGGGILGGVIIGWRTVCAVELDHYCRSVLLARQRDGFLPRFPIWDDVRTFDGRPWRGHVDVISGGFPCQDISPVGSRKGIDGPKSGLWVEMCRILREVQPRYVIVENSADLVVRGLGRVLGDMAQMGFNARWGVFSACSVGAPHVRRRVFIAADAYGFGLQAWPRCPGIGCREPKVPNQQGWADAKPGRWWDAMPGIRVLDDGLAVPVAQLRAVGNGQVPAVVALAWRTLNDAATA